MTEEEMVDLALHLSEQETSSALLRRQQQEEETMMKAIEESLISQTQPCPSAQSQSFLDGTDTTSPLSSRRKLSYPNTEPHRTGNKSSKREKKRKRKEGSPLPEMPDLSQTQKIYSQTTPLSPQLPSEHLHSTETDNQIPRQSQELLQGTRKPSAFLLSSQESLTMTQKSLLSVPKSPTFSRSPALLKNPVPLNSPNCSKDLTVSESPVFSETSEEMEVRCINSTSPVFGRCTQNRMSGLDCKPEVNVPRLSQEILMACETSGFILCSRESLTSFEKSQPSPLKSPTFPRSSAYSKNFALSKNTTFSKCPSFSDTESEEDGGTEQRPGHSASPVFGRSRPVFGRSSPVFGGSSPHQKMRHDRQNSTAAPSVTGDREHQSSIEENSPSPHFGSVNSKRKTRDPLQCPRQGTHSAQSSQQRDPFIIQKTTHPPWEIPDTASLTPRKKRSKRAEVTAPDRTEHSDFDKEVIDLVCRDEDEDETPSLRVSDSPIRSFTSISEATDSLVDFRNQYSARQPSQRRQRGGFKRKLKR